MCVFLDMCARKRGKTDRVGERCFREGGVSLWVCASLSTLYPLFIESKPG